MKTIWVNKEGTTIIPAGTYRVTEGGLLWELLSPPDTEDISQAQSLPSGEQNQDTQF